MRAVACTAVCLASVSAWAEDAYIEANGNQWIVTDYYPSGKTKIVADFQFTDSTIAQQRIFGASHTDSDDFTCSFYINGWSPKRFAWGFKDGVGNWEALMNADISRHQIVFDGPGKKISMRGYDETAQDGPWTNEVSTSISSHPQNNTAKAPLHLFTSFRNGALHYNNDNYKAHAKLYSMQIYDDGVLVHDYVPRIRGGAVGLKDQVTGIFYLSVGDAPFKCGGDIVDEDPYVEATGCQWISTDYYPNQNTKIELDYQVVEPTSQARFFGTEDATCATFTAYLNGKNYLSFANRGTAQATIDGSLSYADYRPGLNGTANLGSDNISRCRLVMSGPDDCFACTNLVLNTGCKYKISSTMTLPTSRAVYPLLLFTSVRDGVLHSSESSNWTANYHAQIRLYSCRIHEFDEERGEFVLVRDYKPIIRNGVPGLKDLVSGRFSSAEATGTASDPFLFGGDIERIVEPDNYVESAGHQWFETGYYPNGETTILTDFAFTKVEASKLIYGVSEGSNAEALGVTCHAYLNGSKQFAYNFRNYTNDVAVDQWKSLNKTPTVGIRYKLTMLCPSKSNKVRVYNETDSGSFNHLAGGNMAAQATRTATTNLFMFTSYRDGYLHKGTATSTADYRSSMKMFGCRIYDAGLLKRDYVPQVVDGTPGMMDMVEGKFYPSAEDPFLFGTAPCKVTDANLAQFADQDIVMNGGILDLGGRTLAVKSIGGFGTVMNGTLTISEKLVFDAATAQDPAKCLVFAVGTEVALPATLEITDADQLDENVVRSTLCTFATARSTIPEVILPKPWRVELRDGGKSLRLVSVMGMRIIVR